jgi:hypothetical protein
VLATSLKQKIVLIAAEPVKLAATGLLLALCVVIHIPIVMCVLDQEEYLIGRKSNLPKISSNMF